MKFTNDQQKATATFREWLLDHRSGFFKLWGYAGTGKTTIAVHLGENIDRVMYGAYTGKAASVMRKKGCVGAKTIHSMIYIPEEIWEEKEVNGKKRREKKVIYHLKSREDKERRRGSRNKDRYFDEYYGADFQIWDANLIIVDECSMVDEKMAKDLLSFGVPVLVIGDPAQLPPVNLGDNDGNLNGYFMHGEPDAMLTEITRQAAESEIIRYSMFLREGSREGKRWVVRKNGGEVSFHDLQSLSIEQGMEADQVICGLNVTRHKVNMRCRDLLGFSKNPYPVRGDKLICLLNDKNVMNGEMFSVLEDSVVSEGAMRLLMQEFDYDGGGWTIAKNLTLPDFEAVGAAERRAWDDLKFGYGYAITCHKAQGSQWNRVIVNDESANFEKHNRGMGARWLYTAVTRAVDEVAIVRDGGRNAHKSALIVA
jgi:exodeoxyribonuclease-5